MSARPRRPEPSRYNETRATYGHSLVADPWGHVVAKASDGVGMVSTRLDMAQVKRVRRMIPVAQHKVSFAASQRLAKPLGAASLGEPGEFRVGVVHG